MSEAKAEMTAEMKALKQKLKSTWMAGDFGQIAKSIEQAGEEFIGRLNVERGEKVLDVACGTGNLAVPAARRGAVVTGVDIAPNLLEQARKWAEVENLEIQFDEGDAENLPYGDASFDTVVSMFGAMFAPRPERVAAELIRVCRPGGRVAMANWTRGGFIGQMFAATAAFVPPPPNMASPILWGDENEVEKRFGPANLDLRFERRTLDFRFAFSPEEVVEHFRRFYGPTQKAFDALADNDEKQLGLRRELENLWRGHNQADDGTTWVVGEYLEVVARRGEN